MEPSAYDSLSLKEIFQRLSDSPEKSLYDYFFNKYYPKLIWFALLFVKQHRMAEEVVSDVMLNIFKKREKLANSENIEGYIFISVKNQSLKLLKKKKRIIYINDYESEEDLIMATNYSPESKYLEDEFYRVVKTSIESLPPKRKLVFTLIKEEGLRYKDVARLLNLSVKTIETHMGLAMKTIYDSISAYKESGNEIVKIYSIRG